MEVGTLIIRLIIAVLAGAVTAWIVGVIIGPERVDRRIPLLAGILVGLLFFFGHIDILH